MSVQTLSIRTSTEADLDRVVEIFLACWQGSYASVLPRILIDSLSEETARGWWAEALSRCPERVLLACASGCSSETEWVLGVCRFSLNGSFSSDGDADDAAQIDSLYVDPAAQGGGVGGQLLRAAGERLLELGAHRAGLWVFADNAPSLGFYLRQGWTPDGQRRVEPQFGEPELHLSKVLGHV
ncbi:GNAT family N-acetyltransferase [Psychromicrobium xiongbiense]|uniref:GNAT family N-acetyltransferase n=1 Tax=Psychromicrobium xiongbiense TaxID=3051184 RepID=UPI0025570CA0|nr:GNAT family N-acetyltransferase [Psychromicrobium sp. YIM S02556]